MSKITVSKPNGQWSEPIYGLDKIRLMKSAIQYEYTATNYWYDRVCKTDFGKDYTLCELEINGQEISARFMDEYPIIDDDKIIWSFFNKDLTKAKFLKMRLATLKEMADNATYLKSVYNALIEMAEVPTPTPEGYCLTFRFEAE